MASPKTRSPLIKTVTSIIVPLITFLFGSGVIWSWKDYEIEKERNAFQKQTIEMQKEKNSFERLSQLAKLNEKLTERFFQFAKLNEGYITLLREYDKYDQTDQIKAGDLEHKMKVNRSQSSVLSKEITTLEENLAKIENREPRDLKSNLPLFTTGVENFENTIGSHQFHSC